MHSYEINSNEALPIPRAKKNPNTLSLKTLPIQNILASAWLLGKKRRKNNITLHRSIGSVFIGKNEKKKLVF
jgi:hypothetical protein